MQRLLNGATTVSDSAIIQIASISRGNYRTLKVNIAGGTATVVLRGRMGPDDATWTDLITFTGSGMNALVLPPQVRASITVISGATVDLWLDAYTA